MLKRIQAIAKTRGSNGARPRLSPSAMSVSCWAAKAASEEARFEKIVPARHRKPLPSAFSSSSSSNLHFNSSASRRHSLAIVASSNQPTPLVAENLGDASSASSSDKPKILIAEKFGEAGIKLHKQFANVDCYYNISSEELCAKISLVDALIVGSGTKVTREEPELSKGRLKVIGRAGVGIDNVDLDVAEHGIALLAAMARNVAQADASDSGAVTAPERREQQQICPRHQPSRLTCARTRTTGPNQRRSEPDLPRLAQSLAKEEEEEEEMSWEVEPTPSQHKLLHWTSTSSLTEP